jgi:hypothetical protein
MIDTTRFILEVPESNLMIQELLKRNASLRGRRYWDAKLPGKFPGTYAFVKAARNGTALLAELSIPKYLHGHNVCGSNNMKEQLALVLNSFGTHFGSSTISTAADRAELLRVDLAMNLMIDPGVTPEAALHVLHDVLHGEGRSLKVFERNGEIQSLYINPSARDQHIKWYSKRRELQLRQIPSEVPQHDRLTEWAQKALRFEVRLNRPALKVYDLTKVSEWSGARAREILKDTLEQLCISGTGLIARDSDAFKVLTPHDRAIALAHINGVDIHRVFARRTILRARPKVLKLARHDLYATVPPIDGMSVQRLIGDPSIRVLAYPKWAR